MDSGDGSTQRLQELAADLDMILPSSGYVDPANEQAMDQTPLDTVEEQRIGITEPPQPLPRERIGIPTRPGIRREGSMPAPSQPPPAPPPLADPPPQPTDSLSLMQLRNLVKEMPRVEPTPYAFTYKDAASLPEEIEEWFAYTTPERANILRAQSCFATEWGVFNDWAFTGDEESSLDWNKTPEPKRRKFMEKLVQGLGEADIERRLEQLEALVYVVLGCWHETAGLEAGIMTLEEASKSIGKAEAQGSGADPAQKTEAEQKRDQAVAELYNKSGLQLQWLQTNVGMLFGLEGGLEAVYSVAQAASQRECSPENGRAENHANKLELEKRETWCALTVLYVCLELARTAEDLDERRAFRSQILSLNPSLLVFLGDIINKIRWDATINGELQQSAEKGPSPKLLLLTWKSILVCLGGLEEVDKIKASFKAEEKVEMEDGFNNGPTITASPLDYHTFRQEISSKYPAYNPPPSYFPLEPDQRSMLPPLRVNTSKPQASSMPIEPAQHGTSILHQPVHIATPAPSPPPSPALGKGGKKQNYQTPHLLPFNYPPLDESSNDIGGKGSTVLQDALVGRKWKGSDIPTSILEAAQLFSKRMRATRALKQLWAERVEFMKYERGWSSAADDDEDVRPSKTEDDEGSVSQLSKDRRRFDGSNEERLATVEKFYKEGLANLQSIVMVLMKTILANVTSLITQAAGQASVQSGFHYQDNQTGTAEGRVNPIMSDPQADIAKLGQDELDKMRGEEIAAKAVTGLLLLMLKWFKVSHVLKFEYLTQLLVDANYIPMVLKLLQTQEIERVVNYRCESEDWNFFRYCRVHSRIGLIDDIPVEAQAPPEEPSDDEAAPPPVIKRRKSSPPAAPETLHQDPASTLPTTFPPEVDELGIPTTQLPAEPITSFSWRNFFTNINYLRILQKVCKNKAHRNLMLITYKSANHLKKSLKVPQPLLRLYTLKLFKSQVPFCGRKWRQGNMRVITAVYLHVRPDLRDDWLSGSDVDAEVEQSVPMEQSLRALTHWYNLREYPEEMGSKRSALEEERDFFARELEKRDWGLMGAGGEDDGGAILEGGNEWGVGQLEGW